MKLHLNSLQDHPENGQLFRSMTQDELEELANDMATNGLIHPIVVRTIGNNQYQIISGHQRVRAARKLGWNEIEAEVVNVPDDKALRMLISANIKVRTLTPMEMARAIRMEKELIREEYGERRGRKGDDEKNVPEGHNLEGGWQEEVSKTFDISETHVRRLDKLNELIKPLQTLVDQGKLSIKAAEQLAYLTPDEQQTLYRE